MYRIGWLGAERNTHIEAFLAQFRALGWVEGGNFVMEYQSVPHRQFPKVVSDLAAELVESKVDIIVAMGSRSTLVAHAATSTIPVVMTASRPVERGLIESFARPGGNITGLTNNPGTGFTGKMLQLLKEAAPEVSRVAVLLNSRSKRLSSPDERVKYWQTITPVTR